MVNLIGPSRRAILIGIDDYAAAPPLKGCVNDVRLMSKLLQGVGGFAPDDIRQLDDKEKTTKQAILDAVEAAIAEAGVNTNLFLYYSGRGVRAPTVASDLSAEIITTWTSYDGGPAGEVPGVEYESALLPVDWSEAARGTLIRYSELRDVLRKAQGARLFVIIDTCHAGGLLGDIVSTPDNRALFFGACRPDEVAYEWTTEEGVVHGAFTYFLGQALLKAQRGATCRQIFEQACTQVTSMFKRQHPQIEGASEQPMFVDDAVERGRVVRVTGRDEEKVTLDAAAAAGITTQSWWAIYPEGTNATTAKVQKLGFVEITAIGSSEVSAKVLSEARVGAIVPGSRAVEEAHSYGEMCLRVEISAPTELSELEGALVRSLSSADLVRVVKPPERSDLLVRLAPPGTPIQMDSDVDKTMAREPMWIIQDSRSLPVMRPTSAKSPYNARYDLEKLGRYLNVLGLTNPNLESPLNGKVELVLQRRNDEGAWVAVEGTPIFHNGDELGIEIHNHHTEGIYASLFDFGLAKSISLLFASPSDQMIRPGEIVRVGWKEETSSGLWLNFPKNVPGSSGTETLKLFATVYPTDLGTLLRQDGTREVPASRQGASTELFQLVDMALSGHGSRDRRALQLPPEHEWTAVERAIELRRERV